ncbi:MAG: LysR family transcriptional regulator [Sulfitobacter sp.]
MQDFNWALFQSFVAVAEHGSLSAAARALGGSQPTLSRHIAQLEQSMGVRLFERSKAGVVLTQKGTVLLGEVSKMADAAARVSPASLNDTPEILGTVRITASQIVATYILPEVLTGLRQTAPGIEIELVASDDTNNLLRREADIALRMYRPTQNDVIAKHIGNLEMGAFATREYLERRGRPDTLADMIDHDLIGYDRSTLIIDGMAALGFKVTRDAFAFRCDDQVVCWQMVRAGFGIGFNQKTIAQQDPHLECVSGDAPVGHLPIWLTAHPEVRQIPRIRRVYDYLGQALAGRLTRP